MEYPKKEGKYGYIYQIANGINVAPDEYGTWTLIARPGAGQKKKKAFGKSEENRQRAIKAGELLAAKLGLTLEKKINTAITFGMMTQEWYKLNAGRWRIGTRERYECIIREHLRPLENLSLEKVNRTVVKELLANLLEIRAPKTVEVIHAVISGIFTEANDLGRISVNPAYGLLKRVLPSKKNRVLNKPDPFNRTDRDLMLVAAWQKLPAPFPLILETMAMSGMRLGETLAFSHDNLDARNCQYNVTESIRSGQLGPPKNGTRLIDLDQELVAKLETHLKRMRKEAPFEERLPGRHLFPGVTQRMVQRAIQRACKLARLRVRNPHDLRHTYATILLMDHHSPAYVQKQLGHSSISITVDIYGHWVPGEGRKNLDKTLRGTKAIPGNHLKLVMRGKE